MVVYTCNAIYEHPMALSLSPDVFTSSAFSIALSFVVYNIVSAQHHLHINFRPMIMCPLEHHSPFVTAMASARVRLRVAVYIRYDDGGGDGRSESIGEKNIEVTI